jgi:3-oxoacyl-[acyl-carrier protein] reductase
MDFALSGKIAVVMAASRGLGRATARALAQEGAHLAIASRSQGRIDIAGAEIRAATGVRVLAQAVDVTRPGDITAFAARVAAEYGHVDVLVNNGGGPPPGTFDSLDDLAFSAATELLLLNVVRTTKAFLPLLRAQRGQGRIITVTSAGAREPLANLMLSNALRPAIHGWTKTLAKELGPEGITVNCVAPGIVGTERIDELVAANSARLDRTPEQVRADMIARIPLGRFGRPEEFAAAVAFLASARASYISGTTIYVDGAAMASVV